MNRYRQSLLGKLHLDPEIVRAKGNHLTLADGRVVKDFLAQYGALPFGHNPDFAVEAVRRHLTEERPVFVQPTVNRGALALARRLDEAAGGHFVGCTFANSGAETVEAGIKLARLRTGRGDVLATRRGFHGKTFSALSATGSDRYKSDHIHDDARFRHVPLGDVDALASELATGRYAAFVVEPVQGEGGMHVASTDYLRAASELCRRYGTLLVLDEVQTGLGRTGHFTAAQAHGVVPDILLLSKALGAGVVPVGAVLYRDTAYTSEFDRKHSSTFASNGLAAAAGLAVVERLLADDGLALAHVREVSAHVDARCEALAARYSHLFTYRGAGLMRALLIEDRTASQNIIVQFAQNGGSLAYVVCGYLLEREGLLTMPLLSESCAIRFEPPLDVSREDVDLFFAAFERVLRLLDAGRYDRLMAFLIGKDEDTLPPVSMRYPVSPDGPMAPRHHEAGSLHRGRKFAFLMHGTSVSDVARVLPHVMQREYTPAERAAMAAWILEVGAVDYSPEVGAEFSVRGQRSVSEGMLIFSPISPTDMMALSAAEKRDLMREYLKVARREGVEVVGLGAYTSVITAGGEVIAADARDLTLTTGNGLTAMMTLGSVESLFGDEAASCTAAVIGARGSVGKVVVAGLAHRFGEVLLAGRPGTEATLLRDVLPDLLRLASNPVVPLAKGSVLARLRARLADDGLLDGALREVDAGLRALGGGLPGPDRSTSAYGRA